MELIQFKYFLAVAKEESVSKAASLLYITQPSLSRQIQSIEKEVGKPLFNRGRKMTLTEDGLLFKKRAEEILSLYEKAEREWLTPDTEVEGEIWIGGGECSGMLVVAAALAKLSKLHPNVKVNLHSGDMDDVCDRLDKGLLDFGLLIEPANLSKYETLPLPQKETWGALLPSSHPLCQKDNIVPDDLLGVPLFTSRHGLDEGSLSKWLAKASGPMEIKGTYNLLHNAEYLAKEGLGVVLCLDGIADVSAGSRLCFRPLEPKVEFSLSLAYKKYQAFSKPAKVFLEILKETLRQN